MNTRKETTLKKILRLSPPDRPGVNFTDLVMKDVYADIKNEVEMNGSLKKLLQRSQLNTPDTSFDTSVMQRVRLAAQQSRLEPLVSKKGWLQFITGIAIFVSLTLLRSGHIETNSVVTRVFGSIYSTLKSVPPLYLLTIVMASSLFLLDQLIRNRLVRHGR